MAIELGKKVDGNFFFATRIQRWGATSFIYSRLCFLETRWVCVHGCDLWGHDGLLSGEAVFCVC